MHTCDDRANALERGKFPSLVRTNPMQPVERGMYLALPHPRWASRGAQARHCRLWRQRVAPRYEVALMVSRQRNQAHQVPVVVMQCARARRLDSVRWPRGTAAIVVPVRANDSPLLHPVGGLPARRTVANGNSLCTLSQSPCLTRVIRWMESE